MANPTVFCKWVCSKCCEEHVIEAGTSANDKIMQSLGFGDYVSKIPEGWHRVGDQIYCGKHSVKIKSVLTIDGEVTEVIRDWSTG